MRRLAPTHIILSGAHGALTGDKALKSKVGETVLFSTPRPIATRARTSSADMATAG